MAIDVETKDLYLRQLGIGARRGGYIVGVSFAIEDGPAYYLPVRHQGGNNLPVENVFAYLKDQAKTFSGDLLGANISYDLDYLANEDIWFTPRYFRDVQIADPIIYELHDSYSLESIAQRYGLPGKNRALLEKAAREYGVDPGHGLWRLPSQFVGAYAEQDAALPLLISRRQEQRIDNEDLWEIYNLESQLLPVLVKMRRRGILIDMQKLAQIEEWSLDQEVLELAKVKDLTGVHIDVGDIMKTDGLAAALDAAGIRYGKTRKTGKPNIDKSLLKNAQHPVAEALLRARKVNKLRTTFAASVRQHLTNGRLHPNLNQIAYENESGEQRGARFGRMSSSNPNIQQQPSRDEFANMWRSIYKPEPGTIWACCDYALQEPRWITHFAALLKLPGAEEAAERFRSDKTFDCHQFMANITGWKRSDAKIMYLGICYGEGGAKVCDQLNKPTRWALSVGSERRILYFDKRSDAEAEAKNHQKKFLWRAAGAEGQSIMDQFDQYAPYVRMLARRAQEQVERKGYIRTVGGRKLHFPVREDLTYDWVHKSLNRLIQGSSADQTKRAMVNLDKEFPEFYMQLQVHDELDSSVATPEIAHKAAEIMATSTPALLPFKVDVELGPSWGEIAK